MKTIAENLDKKQVELNAQITKLNNDVADLKSKANSSNCDELQKQVDDKNLEINKLKSDAVLLQNKINTLNSQLSEQRVEYNFMVKQSQRCTQKLDSCMRGLYHSEPTDKKLPDEGGNGSGTGTGGGPSMGSIDSTFDDVNSSARKLGRAIQIGGELISILQNTSQQNGSSKTTTPNPANPVQAEETTAVQEAEILPTGQQNLLPAVEQVHRATIMTEIQVVQIHLQ